jgi:hypothetical protein
MSIIQAKGGDSYHQKVALNYLKQGITPLTAMEQLKASGYTVMFGTEKVKLQASAVASVMTGFIMAIHQVTSGHATLTKAKGLTFKS